MSRDLLRTGLLLPAVVLAAACADHPAAPRIAPPEVSQRAALECRATLRARTVECRAPAPSGPRANLILGGQGIYVRVATSNVEYAESDDYFAADFTLQNLLDQPLGTDGTSVYGAKVFFHTGPTVTDGTGVVTVTNPDGLGTFTAAGQPYFDYPGVIQPRGISAPRRWEFEVPETVESFIFTLYVETQTPVEPSVLHWRLEGGTPTFLGTVWALWAAAPHNVFAASDGGVVLHFDGNSWRALTTGTESTLYGIWGAAANRVWAVGEFDTVLYWDGETWTQQEDPDLGAGEDDFNGVWGSGADDVWVVGNGGRIVRWDGSDWVDYTDPDNLTIADLYSVWGIAADDVWAVGDDVILHWDGASWTATAPPVAALLFSVRGSAADDVWAVGCGCAQETGVALHWDGNEWTQDTDPDLDPDGLNAVWAAAGDDVWAAGASSLMRYDGGDWTVVQGGLDYPLLALVGTSATNVFAGGPLGFIERWNGASLDTMTVTNPTLYGVWAASDDEAWAVGENGTIVHRDAGTGAWATELCGCGPTLYGVWGTSASSIWAVGDGGTILHHDGTDWDPQTSGTAEDLAGIWGSGPLDVVAVGTGGAIVRYDGTDWTAEASGTSEDLADVWAASASDAFAVGTNGTILRWNGASWSPMTSNTLNHLTGVWGSSSSDVYAVGDDGTVLHYDGNPGGTWDAVASGAPAGVSVNAVWGSGAGDVFVVANGGLDILHYDGAAWKTMTSFSPPADIWFYALHGTGPRNVYGVGDLGAIIHGTR
ncbi:MAG TPA: hypothetical protein VFX98_03250 [Longimicrobiaceae bacterium]|nr:hypothetical protein [Longimicrobiaceae bacterium]